MNVVADDKELLSGRVTGVDSLEEVVLCILDLVRSHVVVVISVKIEVSDDVSKVCKIRLAA